MRELSLHILDICGNATAAGATFVEITVEVERKKNLLRITVSDNGKGMSEDFLKKVLDPFTTTRTTRKVGMGLPLLKTACEGAGGGLSIRSKPGCGTAVEAEFAFDHIDRMPLGDLGATMCLLISGTPQAEFLLKVRVDDASFVLDTRDVRMQMGEIPITENEVLEFVKSFVNENITALYGGADL